MSRKMSRAELEARYEQVDPWGYEANPDDHERRRRILAAARAREPRRTLDVGCGEGWITAELPATELLVAVDSSGKALDRCMARLLSRVGVGVRGFALDIYEDDLREVSELGPYDLVAVTGVLYGCNPAELDRIMAMVAPGGAFLSCHILGRPYCGAWMLKPGAWGELTMHDRFPYRDFVEEMIVVRRAR